jgi:hypothetical protein
MNMVRKHFSYIKDLSYGLNLSKVASFLYEIKDSLYLKISNTRLEVLTPSQTKKEFKFYDILDFLRDVRNNSSVAHGLKPVEKYIAAQCIIAGKKLLEIVFNIDVTDYPFDDKFIQDYIEFIRSI